MTNDGRLECLGCSFLTTLRFSLHHFITPGRRRQPSTFPARVETVPRRRRRAGRPGVGTGPSDPSEPSSASSPPAAGVNHHSRLLTFARRQLNDAAMRYGAWVRHRPHRGAEENGKRNDRRATAGKDRAGKRRRRNQQITNAPRWPPIRAQAGRKLCGDWSKWSGGAPGSGRAARSSRISTRQRSVSRCVGSSEPSG